MLNFGYLLTSLPLMGMGMLGIFIVMAVIAAIVMILNRFA